MKRTPAASKAASMGNAGLRWALLLFAAALVVLLHGVFLSGETLFSNDGPLGQLAAECHRLPARFTGSWLDTVGLGLSGGAASPNISFNLQWLLGPIWFSKLYAIISLFLLGLGAWLFFRQSQLTPLACILGGLAAISNSTFFSVACWGMSPHILTVAMSFFALAALRNSSPRGQWLRVILAGLAVGMGVSEGADVGAIFSLYVAAFVIYQACIADGPRLRNLTMGVARVVLVAVFAGFLASDTILSLVNTSIKNVVQTDENARTPIQRWNWSTQWSLPKTETLGLVVPGLFGYRLDTRNGGTYWGVIGRDQTWNDYNANNKQGTPPKGFVRYTGTGYYEGVLLVLVAVWATIQSVRRRDLVFNPGQRRWLWFWIGVCVVSFLLALGRYAPFYRWLYDLPFLHFSDIRNPVKFLYPFAFGIVVIFAFGIDALQRKYMPATGLDAAYRWGGLGNWWKKASRFEKYWVYACGLIGFGTVIAGFVYSQHSVQLVDYMRSTQVEGNWEAMANYSFHRVVVFLVFFLLATALMMFVFSGAFAGKRAKAGGILLGVLMVLDLGLANQPWITYWNYDDKYTSNPVIDILRDKPFEHRVAITPVQLPTAEKILSQVYQVEWLQQQFPFFNIQAFDMADLPRMPEDLSAFSKAFHQKDTNAPYARLSRAWQITNTRYVLAPLNFGDFWNGRDYLAKSQLQVVDRFELVPKPGVGAVTRVGDLTAQLAPNGRFVLYELTNALPRAKLYTQWQVNTNNDAALKQIFDPGFDPRNTVIVDSGLTSDSAPGTNNEAGGTVEFVDYAPRDLTLKAEASAPSVLLLNDHFDPDWRVLVDGQPAQLLRCNFLMRGVHLEAGTHTVEFLFRPPFKLLYVSLAAIATGLVATGMLVVSAKRNKSPSPVPAPPGSPLPASPPTPVLPPSRKPDTRKKATAGRNGKK